MARVRIFGLHADRPRRLAWPRTPAFHVGNTGSNPVGDATKAPSARFVSRIRGPWSLDRTVTTIRLYLDGVRVGHRKECGQHRQAWDRLRGRHPDLRRTGFGKSR